MADLVNPSDLERALDPEPNRLGNLRSRDRRAERGVVEGELLDRAQGGDEEAFAALFNQHQRRVYSLCLRMTKDPVQAEDLTQEAFLHLFRKISSFRGESQFTTWLHRLVVNVVLMRLRKKSLKMISIEDLLSGREDVSGREASPDYLPREFGQTDLYLAGSVDRVTLAKAIEQLPAGYRSIFLLHDVEGYQHREIAKLKRCSIGNCKSQLHKARTRLRELLRPSGAAPISPGDLCPVG